MILLTKFFRSVNFDVDNFFTVKVWDKSKVHNLMKISVDKI